MTLRRTLTSALACVALATGVTAVSSAPAVAAPAPELRTTTSLGRDWVAYGHTCRYGYLCINAVVNGKRVWRDFYYCGRVYLSYWSGEAIVINNQTPRTRTLLHDRNGKVIDILIGGVAYGGTIYMDPVWSITVC